MFDERSQSRTAHFLIFDVANHATNLIIRDGVSAFAIVPRVSTVDSPGRAVLRNERSAQGRDLVQTFVGHATLQMTMDTYEHMFPSEDHSKAMDAIAKGLFSLENLRGHNDISRRVVS
jgi:integrase